MATTKTTKSKPKQSEENPHLPPDYKAKLDSPTPGTGDKIIEGFDKSAGATALDRTVVLDARVTRLEELMKAAAKGNYALSKAMRQLDGE